MSSARRFWSSIIVQVTAFTVVALVALFICFIALMQTAVAPIIFPDALSDNADSVAELVWLVENSPEELHPFILSSYQSGGRLAVIDERFDERLQEQPALRRQLVDADSDVASRLEDREIRFQRLGVLELRRRTAEISDLPLRAASALQVAVELQNDRVLHIWLAPNATLSGRPEPLFIPTVIMAIVALVLGLTLSAIILRPLGRLEREADRIELGEASVPVLESGPHEVRRISAALNRMKARLAILIGEREQIIAAIAHDVRTGLHRIRLRMDGRSEIGTTELDEDITQMETLISDMLAYARAESPSGPSELIGLITFVESLAEAAPYPVSVTNQAPSFEIAGDPVALRRLFENLLENARRYGEGEISVNVTHNSNGLSIAVEDRGPGLPYDQLETVFQPFERGERSRNRETGGAGLGLGIARAIARAHGASLLLENRAGGGLSAVVTFPEALRT